ncbi:MAG TPA: hypothetical protein VL326_02905, partial [Kofleriaceae bacterium]|nr:hypothetical protein [Kofleriaceae bacterium]
SGGGAKKPQTSPRSVAAAAAPPRPPAKPAFAVGTAPGAERAPVMAVPAPANPPRAEKPTKPDRPTERDKPKVEKSAPVSMQPTGPVPKSEAVASGSGPKRAIPSSPSEILDAWGHALVEIERISITTHGAYEHARVLEWNREKLELGYPPKFEMIAEVADEKDKMDVLRRVLHEHFGHGKDLKITIRVLAETEAAAMPARSVLETQREKSTAERAKRESEAREHPITKHVIQTFGGYIKEIKTDG